MTESNHSDFVERILETFRDQRIPDGPSIDLSSLTADRIQVLTISSDTRRIKRRNWMFRVAKYSGVMGICTLVVASIAWIGLMNHSAVIAFADVQQQLGKARSVRYVNTRLTEDASDPIEAIREPGKTYKNSGDAYQPRIVRIQGRYLQRTETLDSQGEISSIHISDFKKGKHVTLHPKEKRFVELNAQVTIDLDSGKKSEEQIKPTPEVDLYTRISEVPPEAATQLPPRTLGGKQVVGFFWEQKIETKKGALTWERTYWVDPVTKLPVRIEISYHSTDPRSGRSEWVQSGFIFDEQLPADLFSTEPPEGYTRETQKVMGIKLD